MGGRLDKINGSDHLPHLIDLNSNSASPCLIKEHNTLSLTSLSVNRVMFFVWIHRF